MIDQQNQALIEERKQLQSKQLNNKRQQELNHLDNIEKFNDTRDKNFKDTKKGFQNNLQQQYHDSFKNRDEFNQQRSAEKHREKQNVDAGNDAHLKREYERLQQKLAKHELNHQTLDKQVANKKEYERNIKDGNQVDGSQTGLNIGDRGMRERDYKEQLDKQVQIDSAKKRELEQNKRVDTNIGYQNYKKQFDQKYQVSETSNSSPRKDSHFTNEQSLVDNRPTNISYKQNREIIEQKQYKNEERRAHQKQQDAQLVNEHVQYEKEFLKYEKDAKRTQKEEYKKDLDKQTGKR